MKALYAAVLQMGFALGLVALHFRLIDGLDGWLLSRFDDGGATWGQPNLKCYGHVPNSFVLCSGMKGFP
jgi:hypothetical protein